MGTVTVLTTLARVMLLLLSKAITAATRVLPPLLERGYLASCELQVSQHVAPVHLMPYRAHH